MTVVGSGPGLVHRPPHRRVIGRFAAMAAVIGIAMVVGGDAPPAINEAHYLVKAKNFWDASYLGNDPFASSGKAHAMFYVVFGWPTRFCELATTAWIGRIAGWGLVAYGLTELSWAMFRRFTPAIAITIIWIAVMHHGHLAGEWVFGGIEAKVPAYGLALIGLARFVRGNLSRSWVWWGGASSMHVLTGGWSVVAGIVGCVVMSFKRRRVMSIKRRRVTSGKTVRNRGWFDRGLWIGGAIALTGLVPAFALSFGHDDAASAAMIYVYGRIPHHLLPSNFDAVRYRNHAVVVAAAIAFIAIQRSVPLPRPRWDRLRAFATGVIGIEATGLMLGVLPAFAPETAASLLRFYWFRLSDALLPLVIAIVATAWLNVGIRIGPRTASRAVVASRLVLASRVVWASWAFFGLCVVAVAAIGYDAARGGLPVSVRRDIFQLPERSQHVATAEFRDWIDVCRWARQSTPVGTVFLTPRHQQTFKWYSERAEVVNWKDVPQDADRLIDWNRRMRDVFPPRGTGGRTPIMYSGLQRFRRRYQTQYMVVDHRVVPRPVPLQRVYPIDPSDNDTFSVYALPPAD